MKNEHYLAGVSRRDLLRLTAAGVTGVSMSGWLQVLAGEVAAAKTKHKSCILLWMDGGPSHKDTFDLKPGTGQRRRLSSRSRPTCPASRSASISRTSPS